MKTAQPTWRATALSLLMCAGVAAQNGSNYHILTNGPDTLLIGVGAGGKQTADDGLGTWIPGEDLRGAQITSLGDFGYRMPAFREVVCIPRPAPSGPLMIRFPLIAFVEFSGLNANAPPIFTNPACSTPSFPLGASGFIPYGTGPASSVSFLLAAAPPGLPGGVAAMLLPDNGLLGGAGGVIEFAGAAGDVTLGISSTGFCWDIRFTWQPSVVALNDDIDGLWHWVSNSPDANQYWQMSTNEMNIWQSYSVSLDNGGTDVVAFTPNIDYSLLLLSADPSTMATLAPRAPEGSGIYYTQTENVGDEFGNSINPNGGFDVGRGSAALSARGLAGVPNPGTHRGNQDPGNAPGTVATLGFVTWDNGGDLNGSLRLTWLAIDFLGMAGTDPATDPGIPVFGGAIRVPTVSAGLIQPTTLFGFERFGHATSAAPSGWPDPHGFSSGAFGVPAIAGASNQIPISPLPVPCLGLAFNITYGSSGRLDGLGPMTWDPSIAEASGTKQLFLFE